LIKKLLSFTIIFLLIIISIIPIIGTCNYLDDTTPPITTITTDPPEPVGNGWYAPLVGVTLNATDNESGVNATYYQINNEGWITYTHSFHLEECGIIDFQFYSIDNAGNVEETKQLEIKIDCYPPYTYVIIDPPYPDGLNGWYVSNITIILNATDNESGVNETYNKNFTISDDGEDIIITIYSCDNVGNCEKPRNLIFNLDRTKPSINLTYEFSGNPMTGYIFTFTATVTDEKSGMERVEFYFNNVLQKTITGPGPTYQWKVKYVWIPLVIIKAIGYDFAGNNNLDEIYDPKPHSKQQTLPNNANQPTIKIKLGNFFLFRYFSSLLHYLLIQHFIFKIK